MRDKDRQLWYAYDLLWELVQDGTCEPMSPKVCRYAFDALRGLLVDNAGEFRRVDFLEKCMSNLQQKRSVTRSMKLTTAILGEAGSRGSGACFSVAHVRFVRCRNLPGQQAQAPRRQQQCD